MKAHEIDNYEEILEEAELQARSGWEMDFVDYMKAKYDDYGDNTFVSEAQLEKLERIAGI